MDNSSQRIEASEDTWGWLRRGKLKKETEGNDTHSTRPGITHKTPQDQDQETAWGSNMQAVW